MEYFICTLMTNLALPKIAKFTFPPSPKFAVIIFLILVNSLLLMIFEKKMEKFTRNRQIYSPPPPHTQNGLKNKKNKGENYENEWKQCKMGGLGAGFSG